MSATLAVRAGLAVWSFRKPLVVGLATILALPFLLIGLVAAVFAPQPGPGHVLMDPLPTAPVTQPFGCTAYPVEPWSATCPGHHFHSGVDLKAPLGTLVYAASAGTVTVDDQPTGYGLFIVVRRDQELSTLYAHLRTALVASGDSIAAGDPIAQVGSSGCSSGPHLHFEVWIRGGRVDPLPMLPPHSPDASDGPGGGACPP